VFFAHSFGGMLIKEVSTLDLIWGEEVTDSWVKILANSHEVEGDSGDGNIASSTQDILFLGVPQHSEKSLNIPPSSAVDEGNDSPEMLALKRDFRWVAGIECRVFSDMQTVPDIILP
jgi:hypothetical protein